MSEVRKYAEKYGFEHDNNFVAACYRQNTVEDLASIAIVVKNGGDYTQIADADDMKSWGITPEQWIDGIQAALADLETELNN